MISEIKRKWVEALRSEKYTQGQQKLKTPDERFCCLGVLCDIIAPREWTSTEQEDADGVLLGTFDWFHSGDAEMPGQGVQEEAGVDDDTCSKLTVMNDKDELNFNQIANWIESNL